MQSVNGTVINIVNRWVRLIIRRLLPQTPEIVRELEMNILSDHKHFTVTIVQVLQVVVKYILLVPVHQLHMQMEYGI